MAMLRRTALLAHRIAQRSQPGFEQACPACLALQLSEEASSSNRYQSCQFSSLNSLCRITAVMRLHWLFCQPCHHQLCFEMILLQV